MLKFPKYVTVLFVISLLVALLVTITQAQKTTFPPLPDVKGSPKSLIGATGTPKPNEDRPMDSVAPTVTSRKYVETINMVTKGTLDEDIGKFVIHKVDGDYVEVLVSPDILKGISNEKRNTMFKMSEGDRIVTAIAPLSLMKRYAPRPPQLENQSDEE
ncbi:MAG: hypothetical protein B6242_12790 [Anaerolineaceae bacterium 4572_78]|nr:MAG: hypothetical protein B6242_12790 [Anaerolineaceae bacterium 4572_78]